MAATARTGLIWATATLVADQASKLWVMNGLGMREGEHIVVAPFLNLFMVFNRGVSYSLLTGDSRQWQLGLAAFAFVVAIGLVIWLLRASHTRIAAISIGLIAGGAVGNAIDRLYLPGVADFVQLHGFGYSWYIFNVADVAIVAGVVGLLYDSFASNRGNAANSSQDLPRH